MVFTAFVTTRFYAAIDGRVVDFPPIGPNPPGVQALIIRIDTS
jgi:hypothetical protein